ncbi:MAG: RCC1 domain-containing protein [Sandaracinaceae bacterium]
MRLACLTLTVALVAVGCARSNRRPEDVGPAPPNDGGTDGGSTPVAAGPDAGCRCDAEPRCPPAACAERAPPMLTGSLSTTCLTRDGSVHCWPARLPADALDLFTPAAAAPGARALPGVDDAVEAFAGVDHVCARTARRTVECWGRDARYGGLAGRSDVALDAPVTLGIDDAVALSGHFFTTCAARRGGRVDCWGSVGGDDASTPAGRRLPFTSDGTPVPGAPCIAGRDGQVECALVSGEPFVVGIEALGLAPGYRRYRVGPDRASWLELTLQCRVDGDGSVVCRGDNRFGQAAPTIHEPYLEAPRAVDGLPPVVDVTLGWTHACAWTGDGEVYCWGNNVEGQVGDGTFGGRREVARVEGLPPVQAVQAAGAHTCALLRTGGVRCWGSNRLGELGGASLPGSPELLEVDLEDVTDVVTDENLSCAAAGGILHCWGATADEGFGHRWREADTGQREPLAYPAIPARRVDMERGFVGVEAATICVVTPDDELRCARGVGEVPAPLTVAPPAVDDVVVSQIQTCALHDGGRVSCDDNSPYGLQAIEGLDDALAVSLDGSLGCAVRRGGGLRCWEWYLDSPRRLLRQEIDPPVRGLPDDLIDLSLSSASGEDEDGNRVLRRWGLALDREGGVWAWGDNDTGGLVPGGPRVIEVATRLGGVPPLSALSPDVGCGALRDGGAACFLYGEGQVWRMPADAPASDVDWGTDHVCARFGGEVRCAGIDVVGQLGVGSLARSAVPIDVLGLPE